MRNSTEFDTASGLDEKLARAAEESGRGLNRRAFIASGVAVGVGAGLGPFGGAVSALADKPSTSKLGKGDAAILRFLAAAEILETDLWQQYNELGGIQDSEVPGGSGSGPYTKALEVLDEDMPQYIHDNTEDEFTHFTFLNAYLESRGADAVDLKEFATLPSSKATGAQQIGRLTNLMELTVDTSWWTRYRSHTKNPDLGDSFAQAVPALANGEFPAIPRTDNDLKPDMHIQAIANTAGFHFATIEQGGTSLYPALAQRTRDAEALRVVLSIGPTEAMHFQTWQDKAGNAPALTDPTNPSLVFPNLKVSSDEELTANLIMPEPAPFLRKSLPIVSIVRPTNTEGIAMGVVEFLTAMGLFKKQSEDFFDALKQLAREADAARPRG
ncbi:MAG TPA: ferritin-like domain-containing protein [Solirubrobacteraceae bacterium]|nr:ferritin-like domain-containing protein [Solirubrobacteraceae bacterium]